MRESVKDNVLDVYSDIHSSNGNFTVCDTGIYNYIKNKLVNTEAQFEGFIAEDGLLYMYQLTEGKQTHTAVGYKNITRIQTGKNRLTIHFKDTSFSGILTDQQLLVLLAHIQNMMLDQDDNPFVDSTPCYIIGRNIHRRAYISVEFRQI
jgi:hypothetical protein